MNGEDVSSFVFMVANLRAIPWKGKPPFLFDGTVLNSYKLRSRVRSQMESVRIGFESHIIGRCVRDLLINRTPKDFDVISAASLEQIGGLFSRTQIIWCSFPNCLDH